MKRRTITEAVQAVVSPRIPKRRPIRSEANYGNNGAEGFTDEDLERKFKQQGGIVSSKVYNFIEALPHPRMAGLLDEAENFPIKLYKLANKYYDSIIEKLQTKIDEYGADNNDEWYKFKTNNLENFIAGYEILEDRVSELGVGTSGSMRGTVSVRGTLNPDDTQIERLSDKAVKALNEIFNVASKRFELTDADKVLIIQNALHYFK